MGVGVGLGVRISVGVHVGVWLWVCCACIVVDMFLNSHTDLPPTDAGCKTSTFTGKC